MRYTSNGTTLLLLLLSPCAAQRKDEVKANQGNEALNLLHWVHVPKAGGTALARTLKKVICKINPALAAYNPCCRKNLCLHSSSCHAAAGGCPLLTATGRHSSNMAFATSMPCCSNDLVESITASFMVFAFPPQKTLLEDDMGILSLVTWPLVDRATFLLSTGVPRDTLYAHIERKRYPPELLATSTSALLSAAAAQVGFETVESEQKARQGRLGLCSVLTRITDWSSVGNTSKVPRECAQKLTRLSTARRSDVGAYSITIVRHPFQRAVSASMYKGHSPNYDVFGLRPGLWLHPSEKPPGYRNFNFHDYVRADEYQNSLVKLYGDSRGCAQARKCDAVASKEDQTGIPPQNRKTVACTLANQCHAYRNASSYLTEGHLEVAMRMLRRFRFLGLQEAYNSSVLLLAKTFSLGSALDPRDFAKERHTNPEEAYACKGYSRRGLTYDPRVCRAVMEANEFDVRLYEGVHREFCERLKAAGLWEHPMVQAEITGARLCGSLVWSDKGQFCAQFETPEWEERRSNDRRKCARHHPGMVRFRGGLGGTTTDPAL